jgi:hypothetical protein
MYNEKLVTLEDAAIDLGVDKESLQKAVDGVIWVSDDYIELGRKDTLIKAAKKFCNIVGRPFINNDMAEEILSFCESNMYRRTRGQFDLGFLRVAFREDF